MFCWISERTKRQDSPIKVLTRDLFKRMRSVARDEGCYEEPLESDESESSESESEDVELSLDFLDDDLRFFFFLLSLSLRLERFSLSFSFSRFLLELKSITHHHRYITEQSLVVPERSASISGMEWMSDAHRFLSFFSCFSNAASFSVDLWVRTFQA